jgi:hypothetical protein
MHQNTLHFGAVWARSAHPSTARPFRQSCACVGAHPASRSSTPRTHYGRARAYKSANSSARRRHPALAHSCIPPIPSHPIPSSDELLAASRHPVQAADRVGHRRAGRRRARHDQGRQAVGVAVGRAVGAQKPGRDIRALYFMICLSHVSYCLYHEPFLDILNVKHEWARLRLRESMLQSPHGSRVNCSGMSCAGTACASTDRCGARMRGGQGASASAGGGCQLEVMT